MGCLPYIEVKMNFAHYASTTFCEVVSVFLGHIRVYYLLQGVGAAPRKKRLGKLDDRNY